MRRRFALLALLAAPILAIPVLASGFIPLTAERFDVRLPPGSPLEFRGALAISPPSEDFGGLSGLIFENGEALAISDRATWARLSLRIEGGYLKAVTAIETTPLLNATGAPATRWDAEGLTRAPDGDIIASFEGDHRLQRFTSPEAPAGAEIRNPAWEQFTGNSGLEAVATDDQGRLWAIRERSGATTRPFPVFVLERDGTWTEKQLPRDSNYLPTGADFGPDGALWIVERDFSFLTGFRTRIRRATWGSGETPETLETIATFTASDGLDNLEAIDVWQEDGETRLLLLSDDNFAFLQRNIIALFALKDG